MRNKLETHSLGLTAAIIITVTTSMHLFGCSCLHEGVVVGGAGKTNAGLLDNVRFVFQHDDRVFVELEQRFPPQFPDYAALDTFLVSNGVLGQRTSGENPWLKPETQRLLLASTNERLGDRYTVVIPGSLNSGILDLSGVCLLFGRGDTMGLIGILGTGLRESPLLHAKPDYNRVQALAFPGDRCPIQRSRQKCSLPRDTKEEIGRALGKNVQSPHLRIDTIHPVYLRYPDVKGAAVFALDPDRGEELLFFFQQSRNEWLQMPVETILDLLDGMVTPNGGIIFNTIRDTGIGAYMHDPAFFVMPDLDGNGGDEVLIVSVIISRFFSIEVQGKESTGQEGEATRYVLREVHEIDFSV